MANIKDKETLTPEKPAEKKAVAKTTQKKPAIKTDANLNFPALFEMAMTNEKGLEIIKELTALKNQEEDRRAKKEFDLHFAEMQAEFTPIERTKKGSFGKYAPLEKMTEKYGPIISKYHFSYHWEVDPEPVIRGEKILKRTRIIISGYGHERRNTFFDAPELEKSNARNALQDEGTTDTYSHRYTFKAAFGIAEIDEDTDGKLSFGDGIKYADMALQFDECQTVEEAHAKAQVFYKELKGTDAHGVEVVRKLYAQRKKELA